ncbi:MAG: glycogen synthase GlgA [Ignavibacteria bacterium]|nr:glycogen synthase GlgA [Ignavibacteria bacterium]
MKICFLTSECVPFVKTGGLADVSGVLPISLSRLGCEMNVFLPLYNVIDIDRFDLKKLSAFNHAFVSIADKMKNYSVHHLLKNGINYYFIASKEYFHRESIYTNDADEDERYIFFQHCVLNILQRMQYKCDIIHINDWQSALIPELIKTYYAWDNLFNKVKVLFTIHNIAYQGKFSKESVIKANLPNEKFFGGGTYELYGDFNFMKIGIVASHLINTVSPTYAKEILTQEMGTGLDGVLRTRANDITGILNGIDNTVWNPQTDKNIPKNYNFSSLKDKEINKSELQKFAGLPQDKNIPLLGIVSRLAWQKGFELFEPFINNLMTRNVQMIVLGEGETKYVEFFKNVSQKYPEKLYFLNGYNNKLAHQITAGADIFLMPSRYEPCGLNQMYSLNYGTIPIVRKTGGLADTVADITELPNQGNGFVFDAFEAKQFYNKIIFALSAYNNKNLWLKMQQRGMESDFSWDKSAEEYLKLYKRMI